MFFVCDLAVGGEVKLLQFHGAAAEPLAAGEAFDEVVISGGDGLPLRLKGGEGAAVFSGRFVVEEDEVAFGLGEAVAEIVA